MRVACAYVALVALCAARPLEWFAEEPAVDLHKDIPKDLALAVGAMGDMNPPHMYQASEPTSFLQTTTGGHPLECDCERVKCNCVKRCECQLPTSQQNHVASSFLEIVGGKVGESAPLFVDIDTNECFLETGESIGQDQHHMLDCDCDKVKCNCVKHCECSLPSSAAGAQSDALQVAEGTVPTPADKATENLLQEEEGLGSGTELKKAHKKAATKAHEKVEAADSDAPENNDASTESFMKDMGMPDGPSQQRSRVNTADKRLAAKQSEEPANQAKEDADEYKYKYDQEEGSQYGYTYSYDKKAAPHEDSDDHEKSEYSYSYSEDQ